MRVALVLRGSYIALILVIFMQSYIYEELGKCKEKCKWFSC